MYKARAFLAAAILVVACGGVCSAEDAVMPKIQPYGTGQLPFDVDLDMIMSLASASGQKVAKGTTADPNQDASEGHIHFNLQFSRRFGDPSNPHDDSVIGKMWLVVGAGGGLDQSIVNPGPPATTGRVVNTWFGIDKNNFLGGTIGNYAGHNPNLALVEGHFTLKWNIPDWGTRAQVRFGLFDPTFFGFDTNRYANDAKTQFAAPALVNNPIVEYNSVSQILNDSYGAAAWFRFGDVDKFGGTTAEERYGLGLLFQDGTQVVTAGSPTADLQDVVDDPLIMAQFDWRWKPFNDLVGIVRIFTFYNSRTNSASAPVNNTGVWGGGISIDQDLSDSAHAFFRWGTADEKRSDVAQHFSGGFQFDNPLESWTGKYQKFGIGAAYEVFSDIRQKALNNELQMEAYYWVHIKAFNENFWKADLSFTPSLQFIHQADGTDGDVMVYSLRSYLKF
ncbi:MAG: hypothetical protein ACREJ2_19305 [Planctomycetota bacterium]